MLKAVMVEEWLRSLPLANGSKAKIRNLMHSIFNHGMRWEWHDKNPISQVRKRSVIRAALPLKEEMPVFHQAFCSTSKSCPIGDLLLGM